MIITQEHLDKFNEYMDLRNHGQGTIDTYGLYASKLLGRELNQDTINTELSKKRNNYPSFIRNFLQCLNIKDIQIVSPRGRRKSKEIVDHFTYAEIQTILSIVDRKMHIMIRLMFECGLRISEVLSLRKKDFDMVNKIVKGIGKGNKEFRKPIYDQLYLELEIYLRKFENDDLVFHWEGIKHQRKKAWAVVKKQVSKILPYKDPKEIYPHAFRHSCGTYLREQGFDLREIQVVLRHKNLETVSHYTAVDNQKLNTKLKRLFQ